MRSTVSTKQHQVFRCATIKIGGQAANQAAAQRRCRSVLATGRPTCPSWLHCWDLYRTPAGMAGCWTFFWQSAAFLLFVLPLHSFSTIYFSPSRASTQEFLLPFPQASHLLIAGHRNATGRKWVINPTENSGPYAGLSPGMGQRSPGILLGVGFFKVFIHGELLVSQCGGLSSWIGSSLLVPVVACPWFSGAAWGSLFCVDGVFNPPVEAEPGFSWGRHPLALPFTFPRPALAEPGLWCEALPCHTCCTSWLRARQSGDPVALFICGLTTTCSSILPWQDALLNALLNALCLL
jgi:hypothetical protein